MFRFIPSTILAFLFPLFISGQLVWTDPALPIIDQPVTVYFDATQGSGGLAGYTGDVYAHTGVITDSSTSGSDWKYVKTDWGQNTPETKMSRIGQDLYSIAINPTIIDYYGVPVSEQILKMAFVFRSATTVGGDWLEGKTETGGDIFIDVFEAGLNVTFTKPQIFPVIVALNESFEVEINANDSDSLAFYLNNVLLQKVAGTSFDTTLVADSYGKFWVKVVASNTETMVADSFYYSVRKPVVTLEMPQGIRDGINYIDNHTVILSLLAPGKEFVYVIGDFNDWEIDSAYYMYKHTDGERFWLQVNYLETQKEYIFQYFIDGKVRIADPYTDKISDPWNDKDIPEDNYPGLIDYPFGKTTNIASVLQTAQTPYDWQIDDFQASEVEKLVIYELLTRDFTTSSTYQAVIDTLDYLKNLGVNAVEFMPVNEFEGNISWGYNPSFYFAPDKYYGPKDDLKKLIDACHTRGMAVIIDMVLNHAYDQCPFVQMYFDGDNPTPDNPWFNVTSNFTNPDAQWGNDFNHESIYTQNLVDSINSYWMSEYKVDGFRFDFTKGFGNNIKGENDPWGSLYDADRIALLQRMSDEIWERNPDAIVIFEHLSDNTEEKVLANYGILLWGNMNYSYGEAAMGYNENGKSDFSWISYKKRGWNDPHVVGYMESHDEERLMYKCKTYGNSFGNYKIKELPTALDRMKLNAAFFFTIPGPKMIWQFGEMGYDISIEYNGRTGPKPVKWEYLLEPDRKALYDFYKKMISLRNEYPVFQTTDYDLAVNPALKRIVLRHESMNVVILGNFGVQQGEIAGGFPHTGQWYDMLNSGSIEVANANDPINLQAGEYRIYSDVFVGISDLLPDEKPSLKISPNPSRGEITIELPGSLNLFSPGLSYSVDITDLSGRPILSIPVKDGDTNLALDVSSFSEGIYLVRLLKDTSVLGMAKVVIVH